MLHQPSTSLHHLRHLDRLALGNFAGTNLETPARHHTTNLAAKIHIDIAGIFLPADKFLNDNSEWSC